MPILNCLALLDAQRGARGNLEAALRGAGGRGAPEGRRESGQLH